MYCIPKLCLSIIQLLFQYVNDLCTVVNHWFVFDIIVSVIFMKTDVLEFLPAFVNGRCG